MKVVFVLAMCVAAAMAASTKKLDSMDLLRELVEEFKSEKVESQRELQLRSEKEAVDQLRTLVNKMYELEEVDSVKREVCLPEDGDCTNDTSGCCSGLVCQKELKYRAPGKCVRCLAAGSRCGAHSAYGANNCCSGANKCGPYMTMWNECKP